MISLEKLNPNEWASKAKTDYSINGLCKTTTVDELMSCTNFMPANPGCAHFVSASGKCLLAADKAVKVE